MIRESTTDSTIDPTTGSHDRHRPEGASPLAATRIFLERSLRLSLRDGESLLMAVLLPVMMMLLFTFVFGGAMDPEVMGGRSGYLAYVVPAIVITCAGFGASSTAVSVSNDMTTGTMNRLRTMPIVSSTVLLGHTLASLVRNMIATTIVVLVAVAVGFRPGATPLGWVGAAAVIAAWIMAITTVFAMLGLVAGSSEAASGYGFILLFLPYASSGFAPVSSMPGWLQTFAAHQPVTPVIETIRPLLAGAAPALTDVLTALAWCLGLFGLALALIARIFPRRVAR